MSYVEDQANKFGEGIQEVIVNELMRVFEEEINLSTLLYDYNNQAKEDNKAMIKKMKEKNKDSGNEYDNLQAQTIDIKDKSKVLQFGFDKLIEFNKTIIHEIDGKGNLTIKVYRKSNTYTRKIKPTFKINYE